MEAVELRNTFSDEEFSNLTEDDLPCEDGMPMETERHVSQMTLLIETLRLAWHDRQDFYVGGNMFVYFSPKQEFTHDFRGPDVFVVLDVPKREHKSWVVWQEGKGPDVVIELLSPKTVKLDKGKKKLIYQSQLRVPEYFWYDPFSGELAGFELHRGKYQPIRPDKQGRLISQQLDLALVRWQGWYLDTEALWLRWATREGNILPTSAEQADNAQRQASEAQRQASEAQQRAKELETLLARYRQQFGDLSS